MPWVQVAVVGAVLIGIGIVFTVVQFVTSYIKRKENRDVTGDPWDGRTLEWATSSPPPFYNFAVIPTADKIDAFYEAKKNGVELMPAPEHYEPIHMPKNTVTAWWCRRSSSPSASP